MKWLWLLLAFGFILPLKGQRRRNQQDIDREESIPRKPSPPAVGIGQFPFNRGETPIFNFDEGDEAFLQTIPNLIEGLHDMTRYVQAQTKLPSMYGKVFLNCPDCKP